MGEDGRTIALDMLIEPDAPGSNARSCDDCGSGIDSHSGRSASAQPSVPSGYQTTLAYPMPMISFCRQPARARCHRTTDGRDVLARQRALQRVACARVTSLHAPTTSIGLPAPSRAQATRAVPGTLSGIRTGSLGAGSVGVGVGLGTTTGLGIVSGISMGSEPG